jgi:hypothetical protein
LSQYQEHLGDLKKELLGVSHDILSLQEDEVDGDLTDKESALNKSLFQVCVNVKRLLQDSMVASPSRPAEDKGGVKLAKLDVPAFDGNLANWKPFWEQFVITVHDRKGLTNAEKLAYLKHALKDGSAKQVVIGLSNSGDQYSEAIECLRKRFDRPCLIHQAHVRAILDAPPLRHGNGRELRELHDIASQHLRALKAMDQEPSGSFITSMLKLKLDATTMFEWQRYSQETVEVPHFRVLLEFLSLRAQATESSVISFIPDKKHEPTNQKRDRSFSFFTSTVDETCVVCKVGRHPISSLDTL